MIKHLLILILLTVRVEAQLLNGTQDVNVVGGSVSVTGTSQVAQSGTWNINSITNPVAVTLDTSLLSTSANQTNGSQKTQIVNGSNIPVAAKTLNTQLVSSDNSLVTSSVIHGLSTAGGGSYVDVKVTPSGALSTESTITGTVSSTQSGVWNVGISTGSNVIGSISNTSFGISGTLPAFASTPTVNLGTGAFVDRTTAAAPYSNRLSDGTAFYDARQIRALTSSDVVSVSNFPATQAVSATSLPLPTGAATLTEQQSQTTALQILDNTVGSVSGSAATAANLVAGIFNTTLPTLTTGQQSAIQLDNKGRILNSVNNGRMSYSLATTAAAATGFTAPASAAKDIFRFNGSATKTVYIKKIRISATATATQGNNIAVIKRSTANTGGTTVAPTLTPIDSTYAASTASAVYYTATSTTDGTAVGIVRAAKFLLPTPTSLYNPEMIFEFNENAGNPLVLRGTAEGFGVILSVAPGAGNNFLITVDWDEE